MDLLSRMAAEQRKKVLGKTWWQVPVTKNTLQVTESTKKNSSSISDVTDTQKKANCVALIDYFFLIIFLGGGCRI